MAETKNIDAIAGIISSRIFNELRWEISDKTDLNWDCCMRSHLTKAQLEAKTPTKKTHPTDVVFSYTDPYDSDVTKYIQTDLKSYSKATIETSQYGAIQRNIRSLAQQVECSSRSPEWRDKFLHEQNSKYIVHGMLFIYNHDSEYDGELLEKLSSVPSAEFGLPENSMIAVFPPRMIRFLLSVTEEIECRRNLPDDIRQPEDILWQKIPQYEDCGFFYPDKHNKLSTKGIHLPASLEMVTSGLLFYSYQHNFVRNNEGEKLSSKVLNIFWNEDITSESHFIFILEYIFNYQLLSQFDRIFVVTPFSSDSSDYLNNAIVSYAGMYSFNRVQLETLKEKVKSIPIHNQKFSIFDFQVASKNHNRICNFEKA